MKTFHIADKYDSESRVFFRALGFLDGKSYRGMPSRSIPRSDVLKIMTRNPNARHLGDWPTTAEQRQAKEEQRQAKEEQRQRVYNDAMNH